MSAIDPRPRIVRIAAQLARAAAPIRVLSSVAWPQSVRESFLAAGGRELPRLPGYPAFDPAPARTLCAQVLAELEPESGPVDAWLASVARGLDDSANMLAARGTADFYRYARRLYGAPGDILPDESSTPLDLARRVHALLDDISHVDLGEPAPACHLARAVAEDMRKAVGERFGADAPEVQVVDELSANALAGPRRIRLRRTACFTDKDVSQLIHHEAYVHVATSLNGMAQPDLGLLGLTNPRVAKTQEGLAVFAEFISGSMDLDRLSRLADRVVAIQMAIDGADFLEVYRYFLDRVGEPAQAFENSRRVFRGGVLEGGAPFTKDVVYLDGLLRVHNFLRAIVTGGRADCLRLLFCGKLDIEDIPALCELNRLGLCRPARYLPPWAEDLRFLLGYLGYSAFLNTVDLAKVKAHYRHMLADAPRVG